MKIALPLRTRQFFDMFLHGFHYLFEVWLVSYQRRTNQNPRFLKAESCFWNLRCCLQCDYSSRGTWKKIIQSQRFLIQNILKFFCKRTNNIHEFEGCFLRGQITSNGFKVFHGCIVEPGILLVRLQKSFRSLKNVVIE